MRPGAVAECDGRRVAFAIREDGAPDDSHYFVEIRPNRWALFDVQDLARAVNAQLPVQIWHSYFTAAPHARLEAVAAFVAMTGRYFLDIHRQVQARAALADLATTADLAEMECNP